MNDKDIAAKLELYTLQQKTKTALIDFKSDITDSSLWKLDIIFIADVSPSMKNYIKHYENLIKDILIDAENYYSSCVKGVASGESFGEFLNLGLIKFNKEDKKIHLPKSSKMYSYLNDGKEFFQDLNADNVNQSENQIAKTILEAVAGGCGLDLRTDSNKFVIYFMENFKEEVELDSDSVGSLREINYHHEIISFSESLCCSVTNELSSYVEVSALCLY
jgi:hypothetical protein